MEEMIALLQHRRSVPPAFLTEPGPDRVQLDTLLTIAARVPDHGKLVPWRFLIITGAARERLGQVLAQYMRADNPETSSEILELEQARFLSPVVIGLVSCAAPHVKIPEWEQVLSCGAVAMNLTIAACTMGFATSWLTGWPAYDRRFLDILGLTAQERMAGFLHIGTATISPADRIRPEMGQIITWL
jgi:nitroreductase